MRLLLALMLALSAHGAITDLHGNIDNRPRGIRNNNAGNITSIRWQRWHGAIGFDNDGYLIFRRRIDGIRAVVINLKAYRSKYGIRTPFGIVKRWTRGQSQVDQIKYVRVICERLAYHNGVNYVDPYTKIDLNDPEILLSITRSIIYYENGVDPYPDNLYETIFPWVGK